MEPGRQIKREFARHGSFSLLSNTSERADSPRRDRRGSGSEANALAIEATPTTLQEHVFTTHAASQRGSFENII